MKLSEINLNPHLTILAHQGDVSIDNDRPDVVQIGPEDTINYAASIPADVWEEMKGVPRLMKYLRMVVGDMDLSGSLQDLPIAVRHTAGLLMLTADAVVRGKIPYWFLPETYLHPSMCGGLADIAIDMSGASRKP